jgi:hypothetical protein
LAVALVGSASAEGWRLDAGSHRAFKRSLVAAKDELSPESIQLLGGALKHIWDEGTKAAEAQQRRYSDKDYFRQLDGLSYEEVVHFTDATYEAALRYSAASAAAVFAAPSNGRASGAVNPPYRYRHPENDGQFPRMPNSDYVPHGGTDLYGVPGQR